MTSKLTGGTVSFEETKQIQQYEPRKVSITLHFSAEEGRDAEAMLDHASQLVVAKVAQLLSGKLTPTVASRTVDTSGAKEAAAAKLNAAEELPTETPKTVKPPRKITAKDVVKGREADPLEGEVLPPETTKPAAAPAAEENLDDLLGDTPKAEPITDAVLTSKIGAHNAKVKNSPAIRKLVGDFNGNVAGKQARDIPQEKRADFIVQLEKIAAP